MTTWNRTAASAATIGLCLMLSACGDGSGGGVNSVGSAPSGGSQIAAGTNSALTGTLASENFANLAARGTGTFGTNPDATSALATATIIYDATTSAYTLNTGGGTITFTAAEIDSNQSNAASVTYAKRNGGTIDYLTLTRAGTSGRLTYRYVGSAFWQHTVSSSSNVNASIDALVYGVPTPVSAIPRIGQATYALDLMGVSNYLNSLTAIVGTGQAGVDFATGLVSLSGTIPSISGFTATDTFVGTGKLTAGSNALGGTFYFNDIGTFTGSFQGKLFGPQAEEFGAVFQANLSYQNRSIVGTLTGRQSAAIPNTSFDSNGVLPSSQSFATTEIVRNVTTTQGLSNVMTGNSFTNGPVATDSLLVSYDAATKTYLLVAPDRTTTFLNGEPYPNLTGTDGERLTIQNYAGSNTMTRYVKGLSWIYQNSANSRQYRLSNAVFGILTDTAAIPRSGEGAYAISLAGRATDSRAASSMYAGGSGTMLVDFAHGTTSMTALFSMTEDYLYANRLKTKLNGSLVGSGTLSTTGNALSGTLSITGDVNYTGQYSGQFFGPAADELGGTFSATDGANTMSGVILGAQDAATLTTIVNARTPLAQLTAPTTFSPDSSRLAYGLLETPVLTYTPSTDTYVFGTDSRYMGYTTQGSQHSFGPADIDPTRSDAGRTWYSATGADGGTVSGYVATAGAGNPQIALSYTSFADLTVKNGTTPNMAPDRYALVYGNRTAAMNVPTSGSATYDGIAVGNANLAPSAVPVVGTSTLTADFGAGTFASSLSLTLNTAQPQDMGTFGFKGTLGSETRTGTFSGNAVSGPDGFLNGSMQGTFYGPNANEFGAAWTLYTPANGHTTTISGIAVGKK